MQELESLLQREWLKLAQDITILLVEKDESKVAGHYRAALRRLEKVKECRERILEHEGNNNDI